MAGFALKVKTKGGQTVLQSLTLNSTVKELKRTLTSLTHIKENCLLVLCGYPPKPIDISSDDATLESIEIHSGDTLIVEEKPEESILESRVEAREGEPRHHVTDQLECPGILMKKVVPSDNSCLFTSMGFVLGGKVDTSCGSFMRQIIAEVVASDTDTYSEAILGKPNRDYCEWILKPDSWGGAIELAVLSNFYGIEIVVVDTSNAIINRFGEDQKYPQRVFVMFDGIHYDPLYLESLDGADIQTLFPASDERLLQSAMELAREAKSSRQYTDVNRFSLKCMVCEQIMTGQTQAQQHAKETGHMNFGEVNE